MKWPGKSAVAPFRPAVRLWMQLASMAAVVLCVGAAETPVALNRQPTLYLVGYAHLDTQWNWDYTTTIGSYLPGTMRANFALFDKYPDYIFNFSGANRYRMMQEYYPAEFARLKDYVKKGRWFPCGSSWEECDVLVPSPESVIRQVLYGNRFFREELGQTSNEFMIPDCFGFPASLPSVLAHCGLRGFSTQKLAWGSAIGFPFNVGCWVGVDGQSVIMAANCGNYRTRLNSDLSTSHTGTAKDVFVHLNAEEMNWLERITANGRKSGVFADYIYYGEGDMGGAPTEGSVRWMEQSIAGTGAVRAVSATAARMFSDITDAQKTGLPRYQGDLLLTEHSAGTATSQAYMKRWNRANERLADAAERAAVAAEFLGGARYPSRTLQAGWRLLMGTQFHDILPGTSAPRCYEFSMNDEVLALNQFADALQSGVGAVTRGLATDVEGQPLVVYNPLSIEREDLVEATVAGPVRVHGPDGKEVPSQMIASNKVLFAARVPAVGFAVYGVTAGRAATDTGGLKVDLHGLENARYRVRIDANGDVAGIFDKTASKEILSAPARLDFQYEHPWAWPAWNMDWKDRKKPPYAHVEGPATVRVVENGPVRVAVEIRRESLGSIFTQTIRLAAGATGDRVEFATAIDWQTKASSLKAAFPLTVSNPAATYSVGLGTIQRGNNDEKKYEVPHQQWFDLTATDGTYGVTVVDDCKYGSDKPADNLLRLTLLFTPLAQGNADGLNLYYQNTQDWGRHNMLYALAGHSGDWRAARSPWLAARVNNPLRAFQTSPHSGTLGRSFSLLNLDSDQVGVVALKKAESGDGIVARLFELNGRPARHVRLSFAGGLRGAQEIDGQEQVIGPAKLERGKLVVDFTPYQPRAFLLKPVAPSAGMTRPQSMPVRLPYDTDMVSFDANKKDGGGDAGGNTISGELLPATIDSAGVVFNMGPTTDGAMNAVACRGQTIALPEGGFSRAYLLAASVDGDRKGVFGGTELTVQDWGGFIGHWDARHWQGGRLESITPAYIKRDPVAWFGTHRHGANGQNQIYTYTYIYRYAVDLPTGAKTFTLPDNPAIRVYAVTVARDPNDSALPAAPLYDDFTGREPIELRDTGKPPHAGLTPAGTVTMDRKADFASLVMGAPSSTDFADVHAGHGVTVRFAGPEPHAGSFDRAAATSTDVWAGGAATTGAEDKLLSRLNDGDAARNGDDTRRCVWWNGAGRFYMDLRKVVPVASVSTFSRHDVNSGNRAPQRFSLWGCAADAMPSPMFSSGAKSGWTLLARVDSSALGHGGCHGSTVTGAGGAPLGPFRYLLWIADDAGEGTFFTELDVQVP